MNDAMRQSLYSSCTLQVINVISIPRNCFSTSTSTAQVHRSLRPAFSQDACDQILGGRSVAGFTYMWYLLSWETIAEIYLLFCFLLSDVCSYSEPDMVKADMPFNKVDDWLVRASCEIEWYAVGELGHLRWWRDKAFHPSFRWLLPRAFISQRVVVRRSKRRILYPSLPPVHNNNDTNYHFHQHQH